MTMVARIFLVLCFCQMARAENCGTLDASSGQVEVLRVTSGTGEDAVRDVLMAKSPFALDCSDIVVTGVGSAAKLKLRNTIVSMSSNSRVVLAEVDVTGEKSSILQLSYGKIRSFFQRAKPKGKEKSAGFFIRTPTTVTGVRGTDFFVSYEPNTSVTKQATLKGSVDVEHSKTGEKVIVNQGQQVVIEAEKMDVTGKPISKPMEVKPIVPKVVEEIKQASIFAKIEPDFKSPEAIKILGKPETWNQKIDSGVPEDLKDIKNEF